MKSTYWTISLLDMTILCLHVARTASSLPTGQDYIKSTYCTSSLLDRTTPCLHMARTASSVPLYWPGLHQVYLLDKFTEKQDYILSPSLSEEDILSSFLKIESQKFSYLDRTASSPFIERTTSCLIVGQ